MTIRICLASLLCFAACGGDAPLPSPDPTEVTYGDTAIVMWVNARVNDANQRSVPPPGEARAKVLVASDDGPSVETNAEGIAVLTGVGAGARTLTFSGAASGSLAITLVDKELREIAVSVDATGAHLMADLHYRFGDAVVEVMASMSEAQINAALNGSNQIVLFRGGTYTGNYLFSGSFVTLFGEGAQGGTVTISGKVTVNGSNDRIRGTRIVGDLWVDGSGFGFTSSRVTGTLTTTGSDPIYIDNGLCGATTLDGNGRIILETSGLAPIAAPAGGC